jgi:hypothetical protein
MRVLAITHPKCRVQEQIIQRAVRFLAKYKKDVSLLLLELDGFGACLKIQAKSHHVAVEMLEDVRQSQSRLTAFLDRWLRVSDLDLALRVCDEVLLFWDGQQDTRDLLVRARATNKQVIVARTDGKYPIVPCR